MLKWANEASLSFQLCCTSSKGLFTTSKPESIHWNLNMRSSADPPNEGPRFNGLCPLLHGSGAQAGSTKREKN